MFGRNCVAIVCKNPVAYLVDWMGESSVGGGIYSTLVEPKEDGMGMHNVLYFPKLKAESV